MSMMPALVLLVTILQATPAAPPVGVDPDPTLPPMRAMVERYTADRAMFDRVNDGPASEHSMQATFTFIGQWLQRLDAVDFANLDTDGQVDHILLRNHLERELVQLDLQQTQMIEMHSLLPFASTISDLHERHRRFEVVDPQREAGRLHDVTMAVEALQASVQSGDLIAKRTVANRAIRTIDRLRRTLSGWYRFSTRYDPMFTWWVTAPYETLDAAMGDYADTIRRTLIGGGEDNPDDVIIGDPIGRQVLIRLLGLEMIPYTPEELVEIADREYAWCLAEMLKASNELGFGDDWHAALNHVKNQFVAPGEQTALIRDMAYEAVDFLEARDLLTIPELAKRGWRMQMMSPARQKQSPYFLGGEVIIVSYPTNTMQHPDKLMSMRGNNPHFSRAVVHHELIPGHHLQGFMVDRYRAHRQLFDTPFWVEGWALYWEMLLWDLDFQRNAEDRVGMLFWRMHRCARIKFSLSFHLEEMTPEECIDFLVENVGHERANATAEVRRSVLGDYGPLYQAAYMLGGLQIRAMHRDLVQSGQMTNRDFHDFILRQNSIPIELIQAQLTGRVLTPEFRTSWRFYDN